jgi:two-component system chemotaxis response regulator CheB
MRHHDIIAIGSSTGSLDALRQVFFRLPGDLRAALLVVMDVAPEGPDMLADILNAAGPIATKTAAGGDSIVPGRAYVAPASHHLLMENGAVGSGGDLGRTWRDPPSIRRSALLR